MRFPILTLISLLVTVGASFAGAAPAATVSAKKVLISVGEFRKNKDTGPGDIQWRKDACATVHSLANQNVTSGVNITCRSFEALNLMDTYLNQLKGDHDYHMRIIRGYRGNVRIDITNWRERSASDFGTLGWTFRNDIFKQVSKEDAITAAIGNFFSYLAKEESFKKDLLLNALKESKTITYDNKAKSFKSKKNNKKISVESALSLFESESERKKNYLKSSIELGVLLSVNVTKAGSLNTQDESLESLLIGSADIAAMTVTPFENVYSVNAKSFSPLSEYLLEEASQVSASWRDVSLYLGLEKGQSAFAGISSSQTQQQDILIPQLQQSLRSAEGGTPRLKPSGKLIYLF